MNSLQHTLKLCGAVAALGASLTALGAQVPPTVVFSEAVGYKTQHIRGGGAVTFIGLDLLEAPVFEGTLSVADGDTVTAAGTDFGLLLEDGVHYFLDVVYAGSDEALGLNTSIVSWQGDTLLLGDAIAAVLTPGVDRVRIHRLPTVGEVFGKGGDVISGGTAVTADVLFMPDPQGGEAIMLYYSVSPMVGVGWRQVGKPGDMADMPIYFSDGLYIHKSSAGNVMLTQAGMVKQSRAVVVVEEGLNTFSAIFPGGTTLGNSALHDPARPQHSLSAGTAATADTVLLDADGDGEQEVYYYSSGGMQGSGWRQIGKPGDMSNVPLESAFGVLRNGAAITLLRDPSF